MMPPTDDPPDGPLLVLGIVNGVLGLTALVLPLPVVLGSVVRGGGTGAWTTLRVLGVGIGIAAGHVRAAWGRPVRRRAFWALSAGANALAFGVWLGQFGRDATDALPLAILAWCLFVAGVSTRELWRL